MTKYRVPPLFHLNFYYQNESEWPKMDFKHNFENNEFFFIFDNHPPSPPNGEKYHRYFFFFKAFFKYRVLYPL